MNEDIDAEVRQQIRLRRAEGKAPTVLLLSEAGWDALCDRTHGMAAEGTRFMGLLVASAPYHQSERCRVLTYSEAARELEACSFRATPCRHAPSMHRDGQSRNGTCHP